MGIWGRPSSRTLRLGNGPSADSNLSGQSIGPAPPLPEQKALTRRREGASFFRLPTVGEKGARVHRPREDGRRPLDEPPTDGLKVSRARCASAPLTVGARRSPLGHVGLRRVRRRARALVNAERTGCGRRRPMGGGEHLGVARLGVQPVRDVAQVGREQVGVDRREGRGSRALHGLDAVDVGPDGMANDAAVRRRSCGVKGERSR